MQSISIVFPIHNEEKNLEKLLYEWNNQLKNKINFEFILVEDGSKDKTKEIIRSLEKKLPIINLSQFKKRGYTEAVLDGIKYSKKKYILCTDSDNQIKVGSLIKNLNNFPNENEFLIGYRNPRKDPSHRIIYSKLFKIFHDLLFNSNLKDPSCPFVIGSKSTFDKLPQAELKKMREGFWWGFVGVCIIKKIKLIETPIEHFKRVHGEAGYKLYKLIGIIIKNSIGLIKIRFNF